MALVLLLVGALFAVLAIVYFADELAHVDALVDRAARATEASAEEVASARTGVKAFDAVAVGVCGAIALSFVGLGLWTARGSHVARVLTCVAAAAATLCCCGCSGVGAFANSRSTEETAFSTELTRLQGDSAATLVLLLLAAVVIVPLTAIGAFVMLVLPPSNRYFRPPAQPPAPAQGSPYYAFPDESDWTGAFGAEPPTQPEQPRREPPPSAGDEDWNRPPPPPL